MICGYTRTDTQADEMGLRSPPLRWCHKEWFRLSKVIRGNSQTEWRFEEQAKNESRIM
jgi:hypothetical protein